MTCTGDVQKFKNLDVHDEIDDEDNKDDDDDDDDEVFVSVNMVNKRVDIVVLVLVVVVDLSWSSARIQRCSWSPTVALTAAMAPGRIEGI